MVQKIVALIVVVMSISMHIRAVKVDGLRASLESSTNQVLNTQQDFVAQPHAISLLKTSANTAPQVTVTIGVRPSYRNAANSAVTYTDIMVPESSVVALPAGPIVVKQQFIVTPKAPAVVTPSNTPVPSTNFIDTSKYYQRRGAVAAPVVPAPSAGPSASGSNTPPASPPAAIESTLCMVLADYYLIVGEGNNSCYIALSATKDASGAIVPRSFKVWNEAVAPARLMALSTESIRISSIMQDDGQLMITGYPYFSVSAGVKEVLFLGNKPLMVDGVPTAFVIAADGRLFADIIAAVIAAAQLAPTPTPEPKPTPTPSPTPTSVPTPVPAPTPAPAPSPTPTPTAPASDPAKIPATIFADQTKKTPAKKTGVFDMINDFFKGVGNVIATPFKAL